VRPLIIVLHLAAAVVALELAGAEASIFALAVALGGVGVAHPAGLAALRRMESP
jgi:hypothetical protein